MLASDPLRGREALRRFFEGEAIRLEPQPQGHYIAKSRLLPVALLAPELGAFGTATGQSTSPRLFGPGRAPQGGCAGSAAEGGTNNRQSSTNAKRRLKSRLEHGCAGWI